MGRPLKFKTAKELEQKIQQYFDSCFEDKWFDEDERDEAGNIVFEKKQKLSNLRPKQKHIKKQVTVRVPTITGLAVALETSRETLIEYSERKDFVDTIKKAKDFIHWCVEQGMVDNKINVTAAIFNLKNNWGWEDKNINELKGGINLSAEDKQKVSDAIKDIAGNNRANNP